MFASSARRKTSGTLRALAAVAACWAITSCAGDDSADDSSPGKGGGGGSGGSAGSAGSAARGGNAGSAGTARGGNAGAAGRGGSSGRGPGGSPNGGTSGNDSGGDANAGDGGEAGASGGAGGDAGGAAGEAGGGSGGTGGSACDPNPCANDGVCFDWGTAYACDCGPGVSGARCETTPVQAAERSNFGCLLNSAGTISCWGRPDEGQTLPPDGTYTRLGVGPYAHACAVRTNGDLACWGRQAYGAATPPPGSFKDVAAGALFSCGIKGDDTLACWGVIATPPSGTYSRIVAGIAHACALATDGTIQCWGDASNGKTTAPAGTFSTISAGDNHSCALRSDNAGICWGTVSGEGSGYDWFEARSSTACGHRPNGTFGCWNGTTPAPPAGFQSFLPGFTGLCGLTTRGHVECFESSSGPPAQVHATGVAGGSSHSCAIRLDGTALCWGENMAGQSSPPGGTFMSIAASDAASCGVHPDGVLQCWGADAAGMLDEPPGTFEEVAMWGYQACARDRAGKVTCWGNPSPCGAPSNAEFAQADVGCGVHSDDAVECWRCGGMTGLPMTPLAGPFEEVATGAAGACALRESGAVECWDVFASATPPSTLFATIAANSNHFCGVRRADHKLECWGPSSAAYFDGYPPAGTYRSLTVGEFHGCAIDTDFVLHCWGRMPNVPVTGRQ